jgi:hypothetical protein
MSMLTGENTVPATRRARVRADEGFTLVELLVVVSVENETGGVLPTANSDVSHVVTQKDGYTKGEYTATIGYATGTDSPFNFCLRSTVVNGDGSEYFIMDAGGVQKVDGSILLPTGC